MYMGIHVKNNENHTYVWYVLSPEYVGFITI